MPHVVVTWKSDEKGWMTVMNSAPSQAYLHVVGHEFIQEARTVFFSQSEGDSEAPVFYALSFGIRNIRRAIQKGVAVFNSDPTAMWVEFGAHADGKTPVLRYRVFGLTLDFMEVKARGR